MEWKKDSEGNWGPADESIPQPPPRRPSSWSETVSCDGTFEEVYIAGEENTVERNEARPSLQSIPAPRQQQPQQPAAGAGDQDSRSMSSMSALFRNARGERYKSDYASYQFDDDATIDSLSDVFEKKAAAAKKQNARESVGSARKSARYTTVSRRDYNQDDSLDGIIGNVANLHDQEADDTTHGGGDDDDDDDCYGNNNSTNTNNYDDDDEEMAQASRISGSDETTEMANLKSPGSTSSVTEDAETSSSDTFSVRRTKRGNKKRNAVSNRLFCCVFFGLVVLAVVAVAVFFRFYYEKRSSSEANAGDSGATEAPGLGSTSNPTARPTMRPTLPGETYAPTISASPTPGPTTRATGKPTLRPALAETGSPTTKPTTDYIGPLMEFLQDNQVYFERDPFSPDFMAVQWLADEAEARSREGDGNGLVLDKKLLQRFALLTLDYALNRPAGGVAFLENRQWRMNNDFVARDYLNYEKSYTVGVKNIDECGWHGVVCDDEGDDIGTVKEIRFSHNGLTGTIPPEIKLLRDLKVLDLSGNDLGGTIPESLYSIRELERVYLFQNKLTGTISSSIGNWWNITHLHLSHNELSGSIPSNFKSREKIRPIRYLNLYSNQLTGTIPTMRFRKLNFADLGRNKFTGTLPDDIGEKWVELRYLWMDHNQFSGTIPYSYPTVGNGRVEVLSLNHNQLTGWVPGHFQHNKLLEFNVHNNTFTGIDSTACRQSVFVYGEMVEYKAECDICDCDPFCERKCKN